VNIKQIQKEHGSPPVTRPPSRGQAMVEFAITLSLAMILLFVTVQFALIGNAALAVTELAYVGARYASVNNTLDSTAIATYMKSIASPTINENNGGDLSITLTPQAAPRTFGTPLTVTISYNLQNKLFLPNPFLGIQFPTILQNIQTTMMSE
jgi:Flp pilus assembly protein TadG